MSAIRERVSLRGKCSPCCACSSASVSGCCERLGFKATLKDLSLAPVHQLWFLPSRTKHDAPERTSDGKKSNAGDHSAVHHTGAVRHSQTLYSRPQSVYESRCRLVPVFLLRNMQTNGSGHAGSLICITSRHVGYTLLASVGVSACPCSSKNKPSQKESCTQRFSSGTFLLVRAAFTDGGRIASHFTFV